MTMYFLVYTVFQLALLSFFLVVSHNMKAIEIRRSEGRIDWYVVFTILFSFFASFMFYATFVW